MFIFCTVSCDSQLYTLYFLCQKRLFWVHSLISFYLAFSTQVYAIFSEIVGDCIRSSHNTLCLHPPQNLFYSRKISSWLFIPRISVWIPWRKPYLIYYCIWIAWKQVFDNYSFDKEFKEKSIIELATNIRELHVVHGLVFICPSLFISYPTSLDLLHYISNTCMIQKSTEFTPITLSESNPTSPVPDSFSKLPCHSHSLYWILRYSSKNIFF